MTITQFISSQPLERQELLTKLHEIILQKDKTVTAVIAPMMGKEMIIYNALGMFKYGLASVKNHMSLHAMPLYMVPDLFAKYQALLKDAGFQKGCINFKSNEEMPLKVVKEMIVDFSKIDVKALIESHKKSKSKKA